MHIGFLGLGNMGGPMALNLLKAGHSLTVFDLSPASLARLVEAGASAAASRAETRRAQACGPASHTAWGDPRLRNNARAVTGPTWGVSTRRSQARNSSLSICVFLNVTTPGHRVLQRNATRRWGRPCPFGRCLARVSSNPVITPIGVVTQDQGCVKRSPGLTGSCADRISA